MCPARAGNRLLQAMLSGCVPVIVQVRGHMLLSSAIPASLIAPALPTTVSAGSLARTDASHDLVEQRH